MAEDKESIKDELIRASQAAQQGPEVSAVERLIEEAAASRDVRVVGVERADMGTSAGSWSLRVQYGDGAKPVVRDLFLRFEPVGEKAFRDSDFAAQFRVLKCLEETEVPVPRPLYLDADGSVLGTPGYIMEKLEGSVPADFYQTGLIGEASPERRTEMVLDVARTLARLHSVDWRDLDISIILPDAGRSCIESEITRCWDNIAWTAPHMVGDAEAAYDWLIANEPSDPELALCHGDANLTNYMFREGRVVGVLDWEFAFVGPGEFDLAYLMAATETLTIGQEAPVGFPSPKQIKAEYEASTQVSIRDWEYACKRAYFTIASNLWVGLRFIPPEAHERHKVLTDHCLDRIYEKQPLEI